MGRMSNDLQTRITEAELHELRDAFAVYDQGSEDGRVDKEGLANLLRSVGHNPSPGELEEGAMSSLSADGKDTLEFPDFLKLLAKTVKEKESDQELREAFHLLDEEGTGRLPVNMFRDILTGMLGEPKEEVDAMIKEAKPDTQGFINYEDFITLIMH